MIKAKCITNCTWLGRYWRVGMIYEGEAVPPSYFEIISSPEPEPSNPDDPTVEPHDITLVNKYLI